MKSNYTGSQRLVYLIGYTIGIVVNLPLLCFETVRTLYYRRKVAKQIGPNATQFQRGYASAPYMVKQHGVHFTRIWLAVCLRKGEINDFHRGVKQWLVENSGNVK